MARTKKKQEPKTLAYFKGKLRKYDGYNQLVQKIVAGLGPGMERDLMLDEARAEYLNECRLEAEHASNESVFRQVFSLAHGDDYDGCMTAAGDVEYDAYMAEFIQRLKNCEYLPSAFELD